MKKAFVLVIALLMLFSSCSENTVSESGRLVINIHEDISRGLVAVDMDTDHYSIDVVGEAKTTTYPLAKGQSSIAVNLEYGEYQVNVKAYNSESQIIGSGTSTVHIKPFDVKSVAVRVTEIQGDGKLNINIETEATIDVSARLWKGAADTHTTEPFMVVPLVKSDSGYSALSSCPNGFYQVVIHDNESNTDVTCPEALRIVAGYEVPYVLKLARAYDGSIYVVNEIEKTPKMTFSGVFSKYRRMTDIHITVSVENMYPVRYEWYVDEKLQPEQTTAEFNGSVMSSLTNGAHTLKCVAVDNQKKWSEDVSFEYVPVITEFTVPEGIIELGVIGDVLIPKGLQVECLLDGNQIEILKEDHLRKNLNVKGGVLSFRISGADGYYYYLETLKLPEKEVVLVVIDRYIENPGYLHIDYTYKFSLGNYASMYMDVHGRNITFPNANGATGNSAMIPINDHVKERTLKLEPSKYTGFFNRSFGISNTYKVRAIPSDVYVTSGMTSDIEVTNDPIANLNIDLPGVQDGEQVRVASILDSTNNAENVIVDNGKITCDLQPEQVRLRIRPWMGGNDFFLFESDDIMLQEGINNVPVRRIDIAPRHTGINIRANMVEKLRIDMKAICSDTSDIYMGTDGHVRLIYNTSAKDLSYSSSEAGELLIYPIEYEDYEFTATQQTEGSSTFIAISVDLAEAKRIPVKLNYTFDFVPETHNNIWPMIVNVDTGKEYDLDITDGRLTLNMPAGHYKAKGCKYMGFSRVGVETDDDFIISPDKENTISLHEF